jgi:soluble lytic murein transglycosylase
MRALIPLLLAGTLTACAGARPPSPGLPVEVPALQADLALPQAPALVPAPAPALAPEAPPIPEGGAAPEPPGLVIAREVLAAHGERLDAEQQDAAARALLEAEHELGLPVLMMLALIDQESRFDPRAVGPRGSLGLMQVRPFVGRDLAYRWGIPWSGDRALFDPATNVRIGTAYLSEQLEVFGSSHLALAAYNLGPSRLRRRLARGQEEKPVYVHRVMQRYHELRLRYGDPETRIGG